MKKQKKSLFMQDSPGNSYPPSKSHRFKISCCKTIFRVLFKGLEVMLVIVKIIQCFFEIFKR